MRIEAQVANLSELEIREMLDPNAKRRIELTDSKPLFRAYGVAHEGIVTGRLIGAAQTTALQYFRNAVEKIRKALIPGLRCFRGHGQTNEHDGRPEIGEIVGSGMRNVDGKETAVAAVYIYPPYRQDKLDAASFEGDIAFDGGGTVVDVPRITGLALGDRSRNEPAFAGATLLGEIQNMAAGGQGDAMTAEEVKAALVTLKLKPSDLFDEAALKADPIVSAYARAEKQTEYEHARRVEGKLGEEREKLDTVTKQLETSEKKNVGLSRGAVFSGVADERKLTDPQRKFITGNLGQFESDESDDKAVAKAMGTFVDDQLKAFRQHLTDLGLDPETHPANKAGSGADDKKDGKGDGTGADGKGGTGGGTGANDGQPKPITPGNAADPDHNALIPGGKADEAAQKAAAA